MDVCGCCLILLSLFQCLLSLPIDKSSKAVGELTTQPTWQGYLELYGYLKPNSQRKYSKDTVRQALIDFQRAAGIRVTGELDSLTQGAMRWKRCANSDEDLTQVVRAKRYIRPGSKWYKQRLTYSIGNDLPAGSRPISRADVERVIRQAFDAWSSVVNLEFIQVSEGRLADIEILFSRGWHGDRKPFDGPGNKLAHTFYPEFGGDAHFDIDEYYTTNLLNEHGINLYQIALHEFGHALGLRHSSDRESVMYAYYYPNADTKLSAQDITMIQNIYEPRAGKPQSTINDKRTSTTTTSSTTTTTTTSTSSTTTTTTTTTSTTTTTTTTRPTRKTSTTTKTPTTTSTTITTSTTTTTTSTTTTTTTTATTTTTITTTTTTSTSTTTTTTPSKDVYSGNELDPCTIRQWDAVLTTSADIVYFFKGDHYFKLAGSIYESRRARRVRDTWPYVATPIDAALTDTSGYSKLFKGEYFWYIKDEYFSENSVRRLSNAFYINWPRLDAAFHWPMDKQDYIISGSEIYRNTENPAERPRALNTMWSGLPNSLDATFEVKRSHYVYFLKGDDFYTYDPHYHGIKDGTPRSISREIFGCGVYVGQPDIPGRSSNSPYLEFHRIVTEATSAGISLSNPNRIPVNSAICVTFVSFYLILLCLTYALFL